MKVTPRLIFKEIISPPFQMLFDAFTLGWITGASRSGSKCFVATWTYLVDSLALAMHQMEVHYLLKKFAGALLGHQVVLQESRNQQTMNSGMVNENPMILASLWVDIVHWMERL
ncbi:hypothetical protein E2562_019722 [Oryza meyeriana var. granulata]|uniref:Uncharacterized protein n=1 Tax=Oryza meyeriana var. granulata TaxID=110450 RepID=A0A6G1C7V9_9ORYZ|nr:hypothetical protein E2562_019722 [Oryza meyeriana var. granulata]